MLPRSSDTDAFWQAFRRYAEVDHDNYIVASFGDSPDMATELADLVIAGIKRATASLARDYDEGREPTPTPGDFVMMLDGEGRPRFIWSTTEVMIKPLSRSTRRLLGTRVRATEREIGGSLPIAVISLDKRAVKGSS